MRLELTRAHRRFLGLSGPLEPRDDLGVPVDQVIVSVQAAGLFAQVLDATGLHRSGPLFGQIEGGVAQVTYAALGSYGPQALEVASGSFGLSGEYVLGWMDALRVAHPQIEWVGQWMTFPGAQVAPTEAVVPWLERASQIGLVDQHHPLICVGLNRYELQLDAYTYFLGDGETRLRVDSGVRVL